MIGIISVAVLIYQTVILLIIVGSAIFGGRGLCFVVTLLACLWTTTHVFFPPLMVAQFAVVAISFCIGMALGN